MINYARMLTGDNVVKNNWIQLMTVLYFENIITLDRSMESRDYIQCCSSTSHKKHSKLTLYIEDTCSSPILIL